MSTTSVNYTLVICRITKALNIPNKKETISECGEDMEAGLRRPARPMTGRLNWTKLRTHV